MNNNRQKLWIIKDKYINQIVNQREVIRMKESNNQI